MRKLIARLLMNSTISFYCMSAAAAQIDTASKANDNPRVPQSQSRAKMKTEFEVATAKANEKNDFEQFQEQILWEGSASDQLLAAGR